MTLGFEWHHTRKRWAEKLVIFEKKAVSWDLTLGRASPAREMVTVGDVGTVSIIKILSLSPRVEKLNSRR